MVRRDEAAAAGCKICPTCEGTGEVWVAVDGNVRCYTCLGETWIDASGKPYKIDPDPDWPAADAAGANGTL